MGYYLLRIMRPLRAMDIFLIPGLGLGVSAQIVFYSLLFFNRISPPAIIGIHLTGLLCLWIYNQYFLKKGPPTVWGPGQLGAVVVLLAVAGLAAALLAFHRPYGDWDGWAYWNFHANFIFRAGSHWQRVFASSMQGRHPWMLPCMVLWGWSFDGRESTLVPIVISIIFTVSCMGFLVCALKEYVPFYCAVFAGVFLFSIPIYILVGTSQYAEILMAYFILTASVLILDLLRHPSRNAAFLAGLFLGFAASSKDNGIMAAALLSILVMSCLARTTGSRKLIRPLAWGVTTIMVSVLIMKSFDALNVGNYAYDIFWPGLWNPQRWSLIGDCVWNGLFDKPWGMLWPIACAVIWVFQRNWREKEGITLVIKFLIFYFFLYLFIYAASILELKWLLDVSYYRLLYTLVPTLIFVMFYILGSREDERV